MLDFGMLIEEMEKRMFSNELCQAMLDECNSMEDLSIYNKKYLEAKTALEKLISPENLKLLSEAEKTSFNYCKYSITYSFRTGIYTGFEQMFSAQSLSKPYKNRITNELLTVNRMKRHPMYYNLRMLKVCAFEKLHELLDDDEEIKEHITFIDIAWDDWEDTLLRLGFFLGYRYALFICGKIDPRGKCDIISHILTTEYELGFISTSEDLEIKNRGQCEEDREQMSNTLRFLLNLINMSDNE